MNYCVILAGGVGTRLWPASTQSMPKQFVDMMGTGLTQLQDTYHRMLRIFDADKILISTCEEQRALVEQQLPEVPAENILAEPVRRGTYCASLLANVVVTERDSDACVFTTPADQIIMREAQFEEDVRAALEFVNKNHCIVNMGVKPTRPDTFYGYIQASDKIKNGAFSRVRAFTEKPNEEFAEMFLQSGEFYWNTGLYAWHAPLFNAQSRTILPDHTAALYGIIADGKMSRSTTILAHYAQMPNMSLDLTIQDKMKNVYVQVCSFGWADLGNWHNMHEDLPADHNRNVVMHSEVLMDDCTGNVIRVEHGTVAVMQGVKDMVVVLDNGVLFIAPKDNYAKMRKLMTEAQVKLS